MAVIARWTTPSILYKPSAVEMEDISEIYLTIKQCGNTLITKGLDDAEASEAGYLWTLSQEESSLLNSGLAAKIQVDYKTVDAMRYTTIPVTYNITNSGVQEVI